MRFKFPYLFGFGILFLAQTVVFAQDKTEWIRVASDNGEFSVEVPAAHVFFADADGISVSESFRGNLQLTEMNMLNAYVEKTLISFESYRAGKDELRALREKEAFGWKESDVKSGSVKIKQVARQTPEFYGVKKYFSSKNYVYVLTAASRAGETAAMKRFFDSLIFNADGKAAPDSGAKKPLTFSQLKATPVEIDTTAGKTPPANPIRPTTPTDIEPDVAKLVIVSKPHATFTEAARRGMVEGTIRLRVTFSKDGRVSKVSTVQVLPAGLLRQAVFAAIRIKFLPQEKDDEPVTVSRTVEYSFDIY